jgi:small-conductance mechanosensitive channel
MNALSGTNAIWAGVIILVVPTLIIAAAELDERLRQRESPLRQAVRILRSWALPFFALWAILVPVLGVDRESVAVRFAASGLVLACTAAVLSGLKVAIANLRNRPRGDDRRSIPQLVLALPRIGIFLLAGWMLLSGVWGVDLSSALAALGVTSLVVSFALQDTLSGLASGVLLVSDRPFKPGDWIRLGDGDGALVARVVDLNWRTTRVRDRNGDLIVIPNAQLAGAAIVNHSAPEPLHRVVVDLQVAYANPPTLAKAMLLDAAIGTPKVRAEPPPNVRVVQIDDPLMGYQVDLWIDDYADEPQVRSDFGSLVWYQSNRHGVPLPSPAQDLYLYDGVATNEAQVPTLAQIRTGLQGSPLLSSLEEADLDRLAQASRPARFAVGELIIAPDESSRDLILIVEGRAQFLLGEGDEQTVGAEVGESEIIGMLRTSRRDGYDISVRAVTDCEVIIVDADESGEIASRNAELAAALNRVASIRRRRMERVAGRRIAAELEVPDGETS